MKKRGFKQIEIIDFAKIKDSVKENQIIITGKVKILNNKKVLNIDYFTDKGLLLRGFYTNDDYCHLQNNKFTSKGIIDLLYCKWSSFKNAVFYSENDKKNICSFFKNDNFVDGIQQYSNNVINKKEKERKRKINALIRKDLKNTNSLPSDFKKWLKSKSPSHIFINKEGHCYCTNCKKEFETTIKYKHLAKIKCPKCKKNVKVQHLHRCKRIFNEVTWGIYHDFSKDETEVIRYVCFHNQIVVNKDEEKIKDFTEEYDELARVYNRNKFPCMEKKDENWNYTSRNYLSTGGICKNAMFCGYGYLYPYNINSTFEKLGYPRLQLQDYIKSQGEEIWCYLFYSPEKRALLIEQLEKIKAYDFITTLLYKSDTYLEHNFDLGLTSLKKKLKLNNEYFKLFANNKSYEGYQFIKNLQDANIHISLKEMEEWVSVFGYKNARYVKKSVSVKKICKYISEQCKKVNNDTLKGRNYMLESYHHYLDLLTKLNYKMKDIYKFPRDFYKADKRVANEYFDFLTKKREEEKRIMDEKYSATIQEIYRAMRNSEDINLFMRGTSGLLVKVPETAEELRNEGKRLGNCLASYVDSMAKGKTTIFFIRKINEPDKEYYAMEYRNGEIKQLHGMGNCIDKTGKVVAFADAFCNVLNNINFQPPKFNAA